MRAADPLLEVMDRFTAALNSHDLDIILVPVTDDVVFESTSPPDGVRYEGRDAVRRIWGQMLAETPQARFTVEEQFPDGSARAVVRWRYDWGDGHVRGVDIVRLRHGRLAESVAYAIRSAAKKGSRGQAGSLPDRAGQTAPQTTRPPASGPA